MKVTSVTVIKVKREDQPNLKAFATIVLDDILLIRNIRVVDGKNGFFASMPSRRRPDGTYQNLVHPTNADLREIVHTAIFDEYDKVITPATQVDDVDAGSK